LSRESFNVRGADAVSVAEGNTRRGAIASPALTLRGLRTWQVRTIFSEFCDDPVMSNYLRPYPTQQGLCCWIGGHLMEP
jgi:hypothetical protein